MSNHPIDMWWETASALHRAGFLCGIGAVLIAASIFLSQF